MKAKLIFGFVFIFGFLVCMLGGMPRVLSDLRGPDWFERAAGLQVERYDCTNWNGFMLNDCTVTFADADGRGDQLWDWRFGRAPTDRVLLMRRRDDPSIVTTNVSLSTVTNRAIFMLAILFMAVFITGGFVRRLKRIASGPALQTTTRARLRL